MTSKALHGSVLGMCAITLVVIVAATPQRADAAGTDDENAANAVRSDSQGLEEIMVTARKRPESLFDAPLVVSALSKNDIDAFAITDLQGVASMTPGLIINSGGSATLGSISLRGVKTGITDTSLTQPIAIVEDGFQEGRANLTAGFFDMEQIEVLKGPQSLYFGKNSPGGIINLRTVDPGDKFDVTTRYQYEIFSNENLGMIAVDTGEIVDGLAMRVAVQARHYDGYFKNTAETNDVPPAPLISEGGNYPHGAEQIARFTVKYENHGNYDARGKFTFYNSDGSAPNQKLISCPSTGFQRAFSPVQPGTCALNNTILIANVDGDATTEPGLFSDGGKPFLAAHSLLGSLEQNVRLLEDKLTLTSVTGYFDDKYSESQDDSFLTKNAALPFYTHDEYSQVSEELRLASHLDGPFNFMVGGLYEHEDHKNKFILSVDTLFIGGPNIPLGMTHDVSIDTYSSFGQATAQLPWNFSLSAGVRWTEEKQTFLQDAQASLEGSANQYDLGRTDKNTSPEVTLSWKPNQIVNTYASYKQGFKSGGFSFSVFNPVSAESLEYKPETANGGEVGIKTRFINDTLHWNLDVFQYRYHNLQTSVTIPSSIDEITANATETLTKGVETDFQWLVPGVRGLTLYGGLNYDDAKAVNFVTVCYPSQSIAAGCNLNFAGGAYTEQSLNGKQLAEAPTWTGNFGASYTGNVADNLHYTLGGDVDYSSSYQADALYTPIGVQAQATRLNMSLQFFTPDDRWRVAIIGRNLSNVLRVTEVSTTTFTQAGTGTAHPNPGDLIGFYTQPRQLYLQLTARF
jgi:iron complex outermembrane receptor protein